MTGSLRPCLVWSLSHGTPARWLLTLVTLVAAVALEPAAASAAESSGADTSPRPKPPNIVVVLSDDVGFGDVGCYGATRVKTPNIDRLAAQGLRFTDAHSAAATCTPSRYAIMTGQYAWRKRGTGILPGDAALIIDTRSATLPGLLRKAGYATGCVGKWHLGLGDGKPDWNGQIKPGADEVGFDYSFILPATGDRVPCVYVENGRVVGLDPNNPIRVSYGQKVGDEPTGKEHPEMLRMKLSQGHADTIVNGISRIGFMTGGKAARWVDEDIADTITRKATGFIEKNKDRPFFLYFATHDIHVPRVPHKRFTGTSQTGVRGDVTQELDWSVGQVMDTLDRLKLADNTLLIFTSDNGPVVDDGYADGSVEALDGHKPAGPYRGGKYQIYEGGTRIPFVARWPGRIKPGVSDALLCQIDFLATFAALAGREVPPDAGPDSVNVQPALLGESKTGRDHLVEQGGGQVTALRRGDWKFIPRDGGGRGAARAGRRGGAAAARADQGNRGAAAGGPELYDLAKDVGETQNVAAQRPELVQELFAQLQKIRESGRDRP